MGLVFELNNKVSHPVPPSHPSGGYKGRSKVGDSHTCYSTSKELTRARQRSLQSLGYLLKQNEFFQHVKRARGGEN